MMQKKVYDILGVGFGPSNLALAVAIDEQCSETGISAIFLEQKDKFKWHPGMLLPGAEMQISFLKDLATLRNPSSPYTFLNYLKNAGRLSAFANLRNFYPTRIEFNDYLSWVAKNLGRYALYSRKVTKISPYGTEPYTVFEIISEDIGSGNTEVFYAKNIVVAPGGIPTIPFPMKIKTDSQRVWHSSEYLSKIRTFKKNINKPYFFSVIGRGQSAAEIICNLHETFPNATIICIYRGFGLKPADESEFINEIFDSTFVDFIYSMPHQTQKQILAEHADTNYSVVDASLIRHLYKIHYDEKVKGNQRLWFKNLSTVTEINEINDKAQINFVGDFSPISESINVDAVVLATGYSYPNPPKVISSLENYININESTGSASVNRHYRISTDPKLKAGIYVQGCNEKTHGLSDTLLSILPIRAGEILNHLLESSAVTTKRIRAQ